MSHRFSLMSHLEHFQPLTPEKNMAAIWARGIPEWRRQGAPGPCRSVSSPSSSALGIPPFSSSPSLPNCPAPGPLSHQVPRRVASLPCAGRCASRPSGQSHQGGIRAGLSSCLRLKACLDTCRTSPSQACTSCLREAESADSSASTALVTWGKQRVRGSAQPPAPLALGTLASSVLAPKSWGGRENVHTRSLTNSGSPPNPSRAISR